jgi:hypothetical protein
MPWKDPEVARAKMADYRALNREKIAQRSRERYAVNPHKCNNMLGMAKDDIEILKRAIGYLGGER